MNKRDKYVVFLVGVWNYEITVPVLISGWIMEMLSLHVIWPLNWSPARYHGNPHRI